jgi:hypothetical protein
MVGWSSGRSATNPASMGRYPDQKTTYSLAKKWRKNVPGPLGVAATS